MNKLLKLSLVAVTLIQLLSGKVALAAPTKNEVIYTDIRGKPVSGGVTNDASKYIVNNRIDPTSLGLVVYVSQYTAAAVLADATGNPTVGGVQNFPMIFGGTTWDRQRSATALSQTTLNGTLNSFTNTAVGLPVFLGMAFDNTGAANAYRALTSTATGQLNVNCAAGCSAATVSDNAVFTAGSSTVGVGAGVFNDSVAAITSGSAGAYRVTANRGIHVNLRNNAGTEIGTASTPIQTSLANTASNAATSPIYITDSRTQNNTYSAVFTGVTEVNGLMFDLVGSGTKTVYIEHFDMTCTESSPTAQALTGYITSTAPSGGTPGAITVGKNNSGNPSATATANTWSGAAATPGITATNIFGVNLLIATNSMAQAYNRDFVLGQEPTLNGVAQTFSVNGNGTGAICGGSITWIEK